MKFIKPPLTSDVSWKESDTLWNKFKEALEKVLQEEVKTNSLKESIRGTGSRTEYYKKTLMPKIASELQLENSDKEFLRVDHSFNVRIENEKKETPLYSIIFIESENNIDSINDDDENNELEKLCYMNVPLKLIFTWGGHDNGSWRQKKDEKIKEWQSTLDDFKYANRLIGYLGIIVVFEECIEDCFYYCFYYYLWDECGHLVDLKKENKFKI